MTTTTISRSDAQDLVARINTHRASLKRQINVEFEGVHPGFDFPQTKKIAELSQQIADGGWFRLHGQDLLWDRDDCQAARAAWNNGMQAWVADHPGQQLPTADFDDLQDALGVSFHGVLKPAIKFFDALN